MDDAPILPTRRWVLAALLVGPVSLVVIVAALFLGLGAAGAWVGAGVGFASLAVVVSRDRHVRAMAVPWQVWWVGFGVAVTAVVAVVLFAAAGFGFLLLVCGDDCVS